MALWMVSPGCKSGGSCHNHSRAEEGEQCNPAKQPTMKVETISITLWMIIVIKGAKESMDYELCISDTWHGKGWYCAALGKYDLFQREIGWQTDSRSCRMQSTHRQRTFATALEFSRFKHLEKQNKRVKIPPNLGHGSTCQPYRGFQASSRRWRSHSTICQVGGKDCQGHRGAELKYQYSKMTCKCMDEITIGWQVLVDSLPSEESTQELQVLKLLKNPTSFNLSRLLAWLLLRQRVSRQEKHLLKRWGRGRSFWEASRLLCMTLLTGRE